MTLFPLYRNICYNFQIDLVLIKMGLYWPNFSLVFLIHYCPYMGKVKNSSPKKLSADCWPTVADCWPHVGNLLAKCRLRTLVEYQKSLSSQGRTLHIDELADKGSQLHLANKLPTCGQQLADSRPTVGRQSANCWPTVGRLSFTAFSASSRPTVGRLSADCRSTVGRLLAACR